MKKIILFLILLLFPLSGHAQSNKFSLDCDLKNLKEYEGFVCRTVLNGSFNYDKITFDVETSDGIEFNQTRTNFSLIWDVSSNKNEVIAFNKERLLVNGFQEFAILLFETTHYGEQEIKITNIKLYNTEEKEEEELEDFVQQVKVLSLENDLKEITINDKKIKNFKSDIYTYQIDIDSDIKIINLDASLIDDNSKITGIGEFEIDPNARETILPIIVTSELGVNQVYKVHLINKFISEKNFNLSSIEIKDDKGNLIDFQLRENTYEYNIELKSDINKINVISYLEDDNLSFLNSYENQSVEILNGENIVLIKIKDESGFIKTYVLNIVKLLSGKSSNSYLKKLTVEGHELKFNKKVRNYNLAIKKSVSSLVINASSEDKKATIQITGNENLKSGSVIKIIVKAENESKTIYQISITNEEVNYLITFLYVLFPLIIGGLLYKRFKDQLKKPVKSKKGKKTQRKAKTKKQIVSKTKKKTKPKETPPKKSKKVVSKTQTKSKTHKAKPEPKKKKSTQAKQPVKTSNVNTSKYSATKKKRPNKKVRKQKAKSKKQNRRK